MIKILNESPNWFGKYKKTAQVTIFVQYILGKWQWVGYVHLPFEISALGIFTQFWIFRINCDERGGSLVRLTRKFVRYKIVCKAFLFIWSRKRKVENVASSRHKSILFLLLLIWIWFSKNVVRRCICILGGHYWTFERLEGLYLSWICKKQIFNDTPTRNWSFTDTELKNCTSLLLARILWRNRNYERISILIQFSNLSRMVTSTLEPIVPMYQALKYLCGHW